jgi:hypothetical protein
MLTQKPSRNVTTISLIELKSSPVKAMREAEVKLSGGAARTLEVATPRGPYDGYEEAECIPLLRELLAKLEDLRFDDLIRAFTEVALTPVIHVGLECSRVGCPSSSSAGALLEAVNAELTTALAEFEGALAEPDPEKWENDAERAAYADAENPESERDPIEYL